MYPSPFLLELADGSRIEVWKRPDSNVPLVLSAKLPSSVRPFSDRNPPKGHCDSRTMRPACEKFQAAS